MRLRVDEHDGDTQGIAQGNGKVFATARHDHRYPREFSWRPIVAHALFWNYPVPGSGIAGDALLARRLRQEADGLHRELSAEQAPTRNGSLLPLLQYELRRAAWLFDSVVFNAAPDRDTAADLAERLRGLRTQLGPLWEQFNVRNGLAAIEQRFDKLIGLYAVESTDPTPWDGSWGPARRMQTGLHPM